MMSNLEQSSKQPAYQAPAGYHGLDPRLVNTPSPIGAELIDQIPGDHGPHHSGGESCKSCGFAYRPGAADCPSVTFVLAR